jgi:hypothetical protein
VKKLFDLLLLSHLGLLLLLLKLVFLQAWSFQLCLLLLMCFKPLPEFRVMVTVLSLLNGDHEYCSRVHTENGLTWLRKLFASNRIICRWSSQMSQMRFSVEVSFFMCRKIWALSEPFIAMRVIAHVGFLTSVCSQVSSEVEIETEPFVAQSTLKRLFSSVN